MNRTLSDEDFAAIRASLARMAGLVFDDSRRPAICAIFHERLSKSGSKSVGAYLSFIDGPAGVEERQHLLDVVTIQETHFFRNMPQIEALRRHVLPELIERASAQRTSLRIWSAGCSTGEEPYTLAMLVLEVMADRGVSVPVEILGTDVSSAALAVAEAGRYSGRTIQLAEPGAAEKWFTELADGAYDVVDAVREMVQFRVHNLVSEQAPFDLGSLDLVVCRNVTIYFSKETTKDLVRRFYGTLRNGGYLLLGHAETLWQISEDFSLLPIGEAFLYRKDTDPMSRRRGQEIVFPSQAPLPVGLPGALPAGARRPVRPRLRSIRPILPVVRAKLAGTEPRAWDPTPSPSLASRGVPAAAMPSPQEDLTVARLALSEGRYAQAVELATRATGRDAMLVDGYVVAGHALSNSGDDVAALTALRKAIFLDPTSGPAHFLLGTALARRGDSAGAALSFAAAAETLPSTPPETLLALLDGRGLDELVDLCRQLSGETDAPAGLRPDRTG
jgi:chemotaxis protein methyltransferase CheR